MLFCEVCEYLCKPASSFCCDGILCRERSGQQRIDLRLEVRFSSSGIRDRCFSRHFGGDGRRTITKELLEEKGYGADLFHTYCKVGERVCAMTIDQDSSINAVGINMVENLQLPMKPHPRPYSLRRCYDKLDITYQTTVLFSVGKFSCEVLERTSRPGSVRCWPDLSRHKTPSQQELDAGL